MNQIKTSLLTMLNNNFYVLNNENRYLFTTLNIKWPGNPQPSLFDIFVGLDKNKFIDYVMLSQIIENKKYCFHYNYSPENNNPEFSFNTVEL